MSSFGNFLENIYDVLFLPRQGLRLISERRLVGQALLLVFISLLLTPWASYTGAKIFLDFPAAWAAFAVVLLIFWFLSAAVLSMVAELFGGSGSAAGLFAAMGFSVLPRVVIMPVWVIVAFLPEEPKSIATVLIGILVFTWTLFLILESVSASYNISITKALLAVFTSILLVGAAIITITVFTGMALFESQFGL